MSCENPDFEQILLKDHCDLIQYGYTKSASADKIGPKFLRITDIQECIIDWEKVPYCEIDEKQYSKYKLNSEDIVIARTGASTGTSAIYRKGMPEAVFASYLIRIKTDENIEPNFVYYFLQSPRYKSYIESILSGSAQPNANAQQLTDISIPYFSYSEQQKMASILKSLDDKIELLHETNETLEQIAQALFKHWFIDFEFPDENGKPYRSSGGAMKPSPMGMIPEDWDVGQFSRIINITSGKRPEQKFEYKTDDYSIPLIGASSVMGFVKEPLYTNPILVIGRVGTHGIVQRVTHPCYPSDNTLVINSDYYSYVYQLLNSIDYHHLNVGSTQPLITQSSIKQYEIIIPKKNIL